jgi:hypothetical protein
MLSSFARQPGRSERQRVDTLPHIDWYPWTFGKRSWKQKLLRYASSQGMMRSLLSLSLDNTLANHTLGQ